MRVTLAKRQPRGTECCDSCLGNLIVAKADESVIEDFRLNHTLPFSANPVQGESVAKYNIFIPGVGTEQFTLDPDCAESYRK